MDPNYCKGCGTCAPGMRHRLHFHEAGGGMMAKVEPIPQAYAPSHRVGMEASIAVSDAVQLCRAEAIAAYPITPQTHIVEHLSSVVANGELDAEFVNVESEHSAMSACIGMSASGARDLHGHELPGAGPDERDPLHRQRHALRHRHDCGQPGPVRAFVHLERPQRHHVGPGTSAGSRSSWKTARRPSSTPSWPSKSPKTPRCCCPPSSTWTASSSPTW